MKGRAGTGFTLLEVVISMAIITTVLLAVLRLQAQNLDLQAEAEFITVARYLAQDRMSRIQSREKLEAGSLSGDFGENFPDFRYRQEITEVFDPEDFYRVEVQVFRESGTRVKDLSAEAYVYRKKKETGGLDTGVTDPVKPR